LELAKEIVIEEHKEDNTWLDMMKNRIDADSSAKSSTSTESNMGANVESSEVTKDKSKIESSGESEISASKESNVITKEETILSANIKSKTISIEKRLKYLDKKEHRSYYIDKEIIKKIDKLNKKYNIDKSDIVNEALKLLFETLKI
jgi:hypothetical protein